MPISDADLFNLIAADLEAKAPAWQGVFSRAEDPFHVIELLAEAPGKFRVILCEQGEEPIGDNQRGHFQEVSFQVTVSQNRGLPIIRGAHLAIARSPSDKALLTRANEVRDWLRGLPLPVGSTSQRLDYRGRSVVVSFEGVQLDAYHLKFRTIVGLPTPSARP